MSDIISLSIGTLPSRVVQALDNAGLHTVDLLTLDVNEIHRRTRLAIDEVQNLVKGVIAALTCTIEEGQIKTAAERYKEFAFLTTGDKRLDELVGGGIPTGCLTEITGERYNSAIIHPN